MVSAALTFHLDERLFSIEVIDISWTSQAKEYCLEQRLLCEFFQRDLAAKLNQEVDKKIWQVDLSTLRARLMQNNWYKMLAVSRVYPNKISLNVDIEMPIALVTNNSEIFAVAEDGRLLMAVKNSFLPALPVLRDENLYRNFGLRKIAVNLLREISVGSELSLKSIAEMTYSKDESFSLLILPSKNIVKMNADHIAIKAARVAQVIEYLNSNQMNGRVIDARFSKKVLVRLRKGS